MDAPASPPPEPAKHRLIGGDDIHREDVAAVGSIAYRKLYKKREPIYPKSAHGGFRRIKWAAMIVLLAIYYVTPWLRWDRGPERPNQLAMVDFEGRRFWFGPLELWPQEVFYITGLLILASLGIFLATSLFGRVWCGYACPQTVWTDLFLLVERRIEGDRSAQIRLAKAPWSFDKASKKIAKHAAWILIAAATGGAWVFYFGDAPTLFREIFTGQASPAIYLFSAVLTFTTYALAGTMREQVCTYMCPWPRIQAAMMDPHALSVTYRKDRGEPRAPHKKGTSWEGRGDCIDCNQCVAVCPQGIDIRDGFQLECINCGLCIDACDAVMERVGRPKGLIGYDTDDNVARRSAGLAAKTRFVRARTILYAVAMVAVAGVMGYALLTRDMLQLNVIRDRNPAFVVLADGAVRNGYQIKVLNMRPQARDIEISVSAPPGAIITSIEAAPQGQGRFLLRAGGDRVTQAKFYVALPRAGLTTPQLTLAIAASDPSTGDEARNRTTFLTGVRR